MPDTFFQIARNVADSVGMRSISTLIGNPEPHAKAMRVLLVRGCRNLSRERNSSNQGWNVLTREFSFDTIPNQDEYSLPDDFQALIDDTLWDRSSYLRGRGPQSPSQWQFLKSGLVDTPQLSPFYRLARSTSGLGISLYLDPVPDITTPLVLEYMSNNFCLDQDGVTFKDEIENDGDRPLFNSDLVEMDLEWRFRESRGLSYASFLAEFEVERDRRIAEDAGQSVIHIGSTGTLGGISIGNYNIPETNYGVR